MAYTKAKSEHRHGRIQARERVAAYASGGSVPKGNPSLGNVKLTGGGKSGVGRLERAHLAAKNKKS